MESNICNYELVRCLLDVACFSASHFTYAEKLHLFILFIRPSLRRDLEISKDYQFQKQYKVWSELVKGFSIYSATYEKSPTIRWLKSHNSGMKNWNFPKKYTDHKTINSNNYVKLEVNWPRVSQFTTRHSLYWFLKKCCFQLYKYCINVPILVYGAAVYFWMRGFL
jgi:hypothetical protein